MPNETYISTNDVSFPNKKNQTAKETSFALWTLPGNLKASLLLTQNFFATAEKLKIKHRPLAATNLWLGAARVLLQLNNAFNVQSK